MDLQVHGPLFVCFSRRRLQGTFIGVFGNATRTFNEYTGEDYYIHGVVFQRGNFQDTRQHVGNTTSYFGVRVRVVFVCVFLGVTGGPTTRLGTYLVGRHGVRGRVIQGRGFTSFVRNGLRSLLFKVTMDAQEGGEGHRKLAPVLRHGVGQFTMTKFGRHTLARATTIPGQPRDIGGVFAKRVVSLYGFYFTHFTPTRHFTFTRWSPTYNFIGYSIRPSTTRREKVNHVRGNVALSFYCVISSGLGQRVDSSLSLFWGYIYVSIRTGHTHVCHPLVMVFCVVSGLPRGRGQVVLGSILAHGATS